MFDLINAKQKGVSLMGGGGGKGRERRYLFCVLPCFFKVTEKLPSKGIQRDFFYHFANEDGKMTFKSLNAEN